MQLRLAGPREAEIVEEMAQHLDDLYERLLQGGVKANCMKVPGATESVELPGFGMKGWQLW